MKTIINIISWVSFCAITFIIGTASIYVAALVCNYLRDLVPFFQGQWTCLWLVPVMLSVAFTVGGFFILGLTRFGKNYSQIHHHH